MTKGKSPKARYVRYYDVYSADGTRLRAWTNDAEGPTVLLSNGLGTNPHSWPALLDPDCGIHVVSWNHRGVGGSQRPANNRADMESYMEDALAVMDDASIKSAVIPSWSHGVTIAFELAARHPERVDGIMAVAGVPGDTFATMLAPLHLPRPVAKQIMINMARGGYLGGNLFAPFIKRIPWTRLTTKAVQRTGFISREADTDQLRTMLREFCTTNPRWYAHMALGVSQGVRVPLSGIRVPVTFIAGKQDILTGARDMKTAAQRIPDSKYIELNATHFLPLEQPQAIHDELLDLVARAEAHKSSREAAIARAAMAPKAANVEPINPKPAKKAAAAKVTAAKKATARKAGTKKIVAAETAPAKKSATKKTAG
ncbi:MAG: alpha/beta hydrolase [Actinomycetota bacterium]|nr:alpha/beta hydrolase [Actinomycetota bacterium]